MTFSARPPAKVNLTLEVGPRADDGFHPLRSVFLRIGLSDRLTVRQADDGRDRLSVVGPIACPVEGNLVLRAVALLRQRAGLPLPGLAMELEKHIPLAAGLAGGSSDAAAALELAAACWGLGLSAEMRLELASMLGSDVPFFMAGAAAALVEGRGERVTPLPPLAGRPGLLLVTPAIGVSTASAFARFDDVAAPEDRRTADDLAAAWQRGLSTADLLDWTPRLRELNDLWRAAVTLAPELAGLRDQLEASAGRPWLLSGSGSSLYALYASPDEAAEAGQRLAREMSAELTGARLYATDLDGPDPLWRQP